MTLNPAFQPLLEAFAPLAQIDWATIPPVEVRKIMDQPMAGPDPTPVAEVTALSIDAGSHQIPARLYVPAGAGKAPPLVLYFHGGGWVIGSLETHDESCRQLAGYSGAAVLSVGYRLAPEHPFPAPLDDAWAALTLAARADNPFGTDPKRIVVAGDSAGGNIAAALAILSRDRKGPQILHQLLLYPVTDADFATGSYQSFGTGEYFLSADSMRFFWRHYMNGKDPATEPLAAVLRQKDLSALPPATVITGEYDPLRDEGEAYGHRLEAAGVPTTLLRAPGMIHGFLGMTAMVPDAIQWAEKAGHAVRDAVRNA